MYIRRNEKFSRFTCFIMQADRNGRKVAQFAVVPKWPFEEILGDLPDFHHLW